MIVIDPATHERRNNWLALGGLILTCSLFGNAMLLVALYGMQGRC